jgi:hypothetical protein
VQAQPHCCSPQCSGFIAAQRHQGSLSTTLLRLLDTGTWTSHVNIYLPPTKKSTDSCQIRASNLNISTGSKAGVIFHESWLSNHKNVQLASKRPSSFWVQQLFPTDSTDTGLRCFVAQPLYGALTHFGRPYPKHLQTRQLSCVNLTSIGKDKILRTQ